MLTAEGLYKRFGGVAAIRGVSLEVREGEIVGLVGPNGAGKTTLFNLLTGMLPPDQGWVRFRGQTLTGPPWMRAQLGLGRTFQVPRVFPPLTCLDHILLAVDARNGARSTPRPGGPDPRDLLTFVGLVGLEHVPAAQLNPTHRKLLELATVLATDPSLLLLDEPMAGMTPVEVQNTMGLIRRLREERGITVVWVEHLMHAVTKVADRVVVLHQGEVIAEGPPEQVMRDSRVVDVYLGEGTRA
ncbi:MAG: ABC transporter ATP-binding protein [Armatimonadota bacterium]|nr:ABC transporter ATP-binding protein [Armatimonadota bacterium]MDR7440360.1 ABC transporter ATP-binding protein [Armatimonadota bacterium]MDR7563228.1 ABC transporter ATP-binding protein [Armatimonadota bacterium]MDR7568912.1 ABC transporter ATP-binding protein [Armatimonadota bacterium]MDR7601332.1 ABC transporter ATP-binding protein [Armatimonadota bacterium]